MTPPPPPPPFNLLLLPSILHAPPMVAPPPPALDPARAAFALLRSTDAVNPPLEFRVRVPFVDLGRAAKADPPTKCALGDNQAISRQHARIEWHAGTGEWRLTVQGKNGVVVNADPVTGPDAPPRPLASRDILQIGDRRLVWHGPAAEWPVLTGEGLMVVPGAAGVKEEEGGGGGGE